MGETFRSLVTDGPLLAAAGVAALVGLISFASPCVLPLVPGYLAYVSGLVGTGSSDPEPSGSGGTATAVRTEVSPRARMVLGAVLFVLGFTAVFVTLNLLVGALGRLLLQYNDVITRAMGVVTIIVGLGFLGRLPLLQRTKRLSARPATGLAGAPLLGIVFGLGWTPCLGPTLAAVTNLAFQQGTAVRGALLGLAYCLGLGIPFVLVALGARWAVGATSYLRRNAQVVTRVGGVLLVVVGLMLVTGMWTDLMFWLRSWAASTGIGSSL